MVIAVPGDGPLITVTSHKRHSVSNHRQRDCPTDSSALLTVREGTPPTACGYPYKGLAMRKAHPCNYITMQLNGNNQPLGTVLSAKLRMFT